MGLHTRLTLYACPLPPVATNKDGSPGTKPINQSSSWVSAYLIKVSKPEGCSRRQIEIRNYQHTRVVTNGFELARAG